MNEDLDNIHYSPLVKYQFAQLFEEINWNGKNPTTSQQGEILKMLNDNISLYSEGLPLLQNCFAANNGREDEYHTIEKMIYSSFQYILITMLDNMVYTKYFLLAENDYERRFMRGKLRINLNEGFKQLYGFGNNKKETMWGRLEPTMKHFPSIINEQYHELTLLLEEQSKKSTWWKEERDYETHLHAERLYVARMEELNEGKVIIESLKLFDILLAVNEFLTNLHGVLKNYLLDKYKKGELKAE